MTIASQIQDQLKAAIDNSGMSYAAIGRKAGISGQFISMILSGKGTPSNVLLQKLSNVLQTPFTITVMPIRHETKESK